MKPDTRFRNLDKVFWSNVRAISETSEYTVRNERRIKAHTLAEMHAAMTAIGLQTTHLLSSAGHPTDLARKLEAYLHYRAELLNTTVVSNLMNANQAKAAYAEMKERYAP